MFIITELNASPLIFKQSTGKKKKNPTKTQPETIGSTGSFKRHHRSLVTAVADDSGWTSGLHFQFQMQVHSSVSPPSEFSCSKQMASPSSMAASSRILTLPTITLNSVMLTNHPVLCAIKPLHLQIEEASGRQRFCATLPLSSPSHLQNVNQCVCF